MAYVGRFAPSPTGPLHAGSVVTALASWLDARAQRGRWLVRIEDTDTPRCSAAAEAQILAQLASLGLQPDEPPLRQSARGAAYRQALDELLASGAAYPCACTRQAIDEALAAAGAARGRHAERVYPGTCRKGLHGRPARAVRFRTPPPHDADAVVTWCDRRLGIQRQNVARTVGDYTLQRADGLWAYQLAVVVDDAWQGVTDVVRGEDLADNTPRQILLQRALGLPTPRYLHTPLVLAADGHKLSKQNGAQATDTQDALATLRQSGRTLGLQADAGSAADWLAAATAEWRVLAPGVTDAPGLAQWRYVTHRRNTMDPRQQRALLTVALMAAFADGAKADAERTEIKRIAESLGAGDAQLDMGALMQDVLLQRVSLEQAAADLTIAAHRLLAYELAVGVCAADGAQSAAETAFLGSLKRALDVEAAASGVDAQSRALAAITDRPGLDASTTLPPAAAAGAAAGRSVDSAALDRTILNQAMLCGALELLPQSWASMAIIPLQVKLVYGIGLAHGAQLDQGHVKEFIATVGVGLTSQYLEQFGRKLLGGLLGTLAGGLGRGLGSATTGMAMSFASTYALGQLARRYYAGGRQMNTALLQQTYQALLTDARQLQQQHLPQMQQRANTLDVAQVMDLVRKPAA